MSLFVCFFIGFFVTFLSDHDVLGANLAVSIRGKRCLFVCLFSGAGVIVNDVVVLGSCILRSWREFLYHSGEAFCSFFSSSSFLYRRKKKSSRLFTLLITMVQLNRGWLMVKVTVGGGTVFFF